MRNSLSDAHPFSKIIYSLFIILVSFLVIITIAFLLAIPVFNTSFSDISSLSKDYTDPTQLRFLKYLQIFQSIGLFIVPAFIIGFLFHTKTKIYLGFNQTSRFLVILTIFIFVAAIPIINSMAMLNESLNLPDWLNGLEAWMQRQESNAAKLTEAFLNMENLGSLLFNIFMIGVLPAIGEELIFRGIMQKLFAEWTKNIHWGIIMAAILFSAMHMQFYGFLPRLFLGILLGYLFYWSGSIWIPILGHFVNNSMAIIAYYLYGEQVKENMENLGGAYSILTTFIVGALLATPLIYLFYKNSRPSKY